MALHVAVCLPFSTVLPLLYVGYDKFTEILCFGIGTHPQMNSLERMQGYFKVHVDILVQVGLRLREKYNLGHKYYAPQVQTGVPTHDLQVMIVDLHFMSLRCLL